MSLTALIEPLSGAALWPETVPKPCSAPDDATSPRSARAWLDDRDRADQPPGTVQCCETVSGFGYRDVAGRRGAVRGTMVSRLAAKVWRCGLVARCGPSPTLRCAGVRSPKRRRAFARLRWWGRCRVLDGPSLQIVNVPSRPCHGQH